MAKDAAYYEQLARAIAQQRGISPDVFAQQIKQESGFNPTARSGAGALGIAQIVPKWHPGVDPMDPVASLKYAADWDAKLLKQYKGDWRPVLSVYNSGQANKYLDPNFAKGQTYNYVRSILGNADPQQAPPTDSPAVSSPAPSASTPHEQLASSAPELDVMRTSLLTNLLGSLGSYASGKKEDSSGVGLSSLLQTLMTPQQPSAPQEPAPALAQAVSAQGGGQSVMPEQGGGGIVEAFYDPLGSYDNGAFGGPIGGHSDHVHLSFGNSQTALRAIAMAQKMGLSARENPYVDPVDPVHVKGSYHYKDFPGLFNGKQLGEAGDFSGSPELMAAFYRAFTDQYRSKS